MISRFRQGTGEEILEIYEDHCNCCKKELFAGSATLGNPIEARETDTHGGKIIDTRRRDERQSTDAIDKTGVSIL